MAGYETDQRIMWIAYVGGNRETSGEGYLMPDVELRKQEVKKR